MSGAPDIILALEFEFLACLSIFTVIYKGMETSEKTGAVNEPISGIPIRFRVPSRLPSVIAQHLIVQPTDGGVLLSFYEVIPPVVTQPLSEDEIKEIKEAGVIAECVSKVFVPSSKYIDFVNTMNSILPVSDESDKSDELDELEDNK